MDLAALSAESPTLAGLFSGSASGAISFQARGATRSDLLASLECQGTAQVANPELRSIDLGTSLREGEFQSGSDEFARVSAAFSCARRMIEFQNLDLVRADTQIEGSGTVDFSRNLDMRLQVMPAPSGQPEPIHRLTGPLAAPQVTSATPPPHRSR